MTRATVLDIREQVRQRIESTHSVAPEPVAHIPIWELARKLGKSPAGVIGECSIAGIEISELDGYRGTKVVRASDAELLIRRLRQGGR
jgi:hypothetical protein